MLPHLRRDASFIIRIWWERRIGTGPLWRGQVIHAKSGQTRYFDRMEDLLAFVEQWTGELQTEGVQDLPPAGQSIERMETQDES